MFYEKLATLPLTVRYGLETISYRSSDIWMLVPEELKNSTTLDSYIKKKIKLWKCENCKLCATFVQNIGFI